MSLISVVYILLSPWKRYILQRKKERKKERNRKKEITTRSKFRKSPRFRFI